MSKTYKIRKGLNIRLVGEAEKVKASVAPSEIYALKPTDFHGLTPKVVSKPGDKVKAGDVVFYDKYNEAIKFVAPVSGEVQEIVRGAKRRILEVTIKADSEIAYAQLKQADPNDLSREDVVKQILSAGMWPFIKQRPIDIIADPEDKPKAIFISGFDSAPLGPDYDFILHGDKGYFQNGINALKKLTEGSIHLGLRGDGTADEVFNRVQGVQKSQFSGPHPAGTVGVQIHKVSPINKGEVVWTINPQSVYMIGRMFAEGKADFSKVIAITGSEAKNPKYYKVVSGACVKNICDEQQKEGDVRCISGNPLTGDHIESEGYLGFYHDQMTFLPEGNEAKFSFTQGWLSPGFGKFSNSKLYPTWLTPGKKYALDTNTNGEERAFVVTGELEKVFPFDIYPMQLVKSMQFRDIDLMENLGAYEIAPEDFALCEFVCTSKIEIQDIVRDGLDYLKKEVM